jgi:hypothetical protein
MKFRSHQMAPVSGKAGKVTALAAAFTLFTTIPAHAYTFTSTLNTGTVMEFYLNGHNGTPLHLWPGNGGANQRWTPEAQQPDATYELANDWWYDSFCMDITNGKLANNVQIQGWECIGDPQQFWALEEDPGPIFSGEGYSVTWCLDDYNGYLYQGARIKLWQCLYDRDQTWQF